jgi:uncharacterized protein YcbX
MLMRVGTVKEIWRYPVKSMGGERLESAEIGTAGIPGDRGWAIRDEVKGGIRGAKKFAGLMRFNARYPEPPGGEKAGPAEITTPSGDTFMSDAPDAGDRLCGELGRRVTLWPLLPADKLDHYRRGQPDHEDLEKELRSIFALEPGEPLPDLSALPPEVYEYESPPGTYFDAFPLLVMTDASLAKLQDLAPESQIDVRRFRPNLVVAVEDGMEGFVETAWVGGKLGLGGATLDITMSCPRCVMTTLPFADLPHDPKIMRTLVREAGQSLGVYASVTVAGPVSIGDAVEVVDG